MFLYNLTVISVHTWRVAPLLFRPTQLLEAGPPRYRVHGSRCRGGCSSLAAESDFSRVRVHLRDGLHARLESIPCSVGCKHGLRHQDTAVAHPVRYRGGEATRSCAMLCCAMRRTNLSPERPRTHPASPLSQYPTCQIRATRQLVSRPIMTQRKTALPAYP